MCITNCPDEELARAGALGQIVLSALLYRLECDRLVFGSAQHNHRQRRIGLSNSGEGWQSITVRKAQVKKNYINSPPGEPFCGGSEGIRPGQIKIDTIGWAGQPALDQTRIVRVILDHQYLQCINHLVPLTSRSR